MRGPVPGYFDLEGKMKYDAWTAYKGWSESQARAEFLKTCKSILEQNGYGWEDPRKVPVTQAYETCVSKEMRLGKSLREIQTETLIYI